MSIETSSLGRTLIIADDLTGACDATVAFSSRGARAKVLIESDCFPSAGVEVLAICTETRGTDSDRAVDAIRRVAQRAELSKDSKQYGQIFKKVDSTFRGNTFHEIRAVYDAFRDHFVVVAPAYPAMGRIAVDGVVKVRDLASESSIAVRDGLAGVGLRPWWIAGSQSMREVGRQMSDSLREGSRMVFCDAVSDSDLRNVIEATKGIEAETAIRILWVGSAGLAHALAERIVAGLPSGRVQGVDEKRWGGGSTVIFAGSRHPVTLRQMDDLRKQMAPPSVIVVRVDCGETTVDEIRDAVQNLKADAVSCLVMTGGDTAMLVCRALGIESLRLHEEFEPGIPRATVVGGRFDGCMAILKSGGFGTEDVLIRIARRFSAERVPAQ